MNMSINPKKNIYCIFLFYRKRKSSAELTKELLICQIVSEQLRSKKFKIEIRELESDKILDNEIKKEQLTSLKLNNFEMKFKLEQMGCVLEE